MLGAINGKIQKIEDKLGSPGTTIVIRDTYTKFDCADCGQPFLLNEGQMKKRYEKGRIFYCPAGHQNVFNQ